MNILLRKLIAMRVRLSTFVIVLAVELAVLAAAIGIVRELRYANMRASCANGLKAQVADGHNLRVARRSLHGLDPRLPTSVLLPQHIIQRLLHSRWIAGHQPGDDARQHQAHR